MTATATQRRALWLGHTHAPREGVTKALRGTLWRPGWLLVAHNDRLMPNPTGGFNNANAVNDGGPLSVAGADADGGLRFIAREPNVMLTIIATGGPSITVAPSASKIAIGISGTVSTTAINIYHLVKQHGLASKLLGVAYTGAGTSLHGTLSSTAVPFVRPYGIARGEVDCRDTTGADVDLDPNLTGSTAESGIAGLLIAGSVVANPQTMYAVDNQTVSPFPLDLQLELPCRQIINGIAYCDLGR